MNKNIFVGICNSQTVVPAKFAWSLLLMRHPLPIKLGISEHPWDVVRNNKLIKWFLDSDCEYFVKMDVDQSYPVDYFEKMIPLIDKYKVIGPVICDRSSQNAFKPLSFATHDYPRLTWFELEGKTGIVEIPYPHTNLFYHREVLEKIPQPWYEAHLSTNGLDRANHVDFTFLDKIKQTGYPIYINLDVEVSHLSTLYVNREVSKIWTYGIKSFS